MELIINLLQSLVDSCTAVFTFFGTITGYLFKLLGMFVSLLQMIIDVFV